MRKDKIETLNTVTSKQFPQRAQSAKIITNRQNIINQDDRPVLKVKHTRKKDEMAEEIIKLKDTVNKLL